jgi:TonB family protein
VLALLLALAVPNAASIDGRYYERGAHGVFSFGDVSSSRWPGVPAPSVVTRPRDPLVVGPLATSAIVAVVDRRMHEIRYCYHRRLLRQPQLAGELAVRFTVSGSGRVASAHVSSSTVPDAAVGDCAATYFRWMQFPAPAGGRRVVVSYPFLFSPG